MKYFLTSFLFLAFGTILAQNITFFQIDPIHVKQIDQIESNNLGVEKFVTYEMSVSSDFFPDASKYDFGQPKIFVRPKQNEFIPCQVEYYFSKNDLIVRLINYTWDTKNTTTSLQDLMNEENDQSGNLKKYNSEYDIIANYLTQILGNPLTGSGTVEKKHQQGYPDWFERKLIWEKDKATVELIMIWSDQGGVLGTYRIRNIIYWD